MRTDTIYVKRLTIDRLIARQFVDKMIQPESWKQIKIRDVLWDRILAVGKEKKIKGIVYSALCESRQMKIQNK